MSDRSLDDYHNLSAVLGGRVSGQVTEWPVIRRELMKLAESCEAKDTRIAELEAENAELRDQQEELLAELSGLIALIDYESLTLPARKLMAKCMQTTDSASQP